MKYTIFPTIVLILIFINVTSAQITQPSTYTIKSDSGVEGTASIANSFYFDGTFKVDISLKKFTITSVTTSIGYFSGSDLKKQGIIFPVDCNDCSFMLNGLAEVLFTDTKGIVKLPFTNTKRFDQNNEITLNVPLETPTKVNQYEQHIKDWSSTGKLAELKATNLKGSVLTDIIKSVKGIAKQRTDKAKLLELNNEISNLDKNKSLKKLYGARNQFYDKNSIDSLITAVELGTTEASSNDVINIYEEDQNKIISTQKTTKVVSDKENSTPIQDSSILQTHLELPVKTTEGDSANPKTKPFKSAIIETENTAILASSDNEDSLSSLITNDDNNTLAEIIEEPSKKTKVSKRKVKVKKLSQLSNDDFKFSTDISKYRRSSLHTIMLQNPDTEQKEVIEETFLNRPLPEKFNPHHIATNFISVNRKARKQEKVIEDHLLKKNIAKEMVAKWFNRNEKGEFNMDLIAERGHYNATVFDLNIARKSERGLAMLADAGEQLLANTFVVVNDYKYTNKEEVAKKTGFLTNLISAAATAVGADDIALIADAATITTGIAGKGYVVKVTSYLYRLKWNEAIANTFYEKFWVDAKNFDPLKKTAFDNTNFFELELLGYETDFSAVQSSSFTSKSDAELIERATVKATDQTIAKLQRKFEIFRTKTPLISTVPLAAKIGMKEGLQKGDKYEVLEQLLNDDGTISFKRVGIIKVDKNKIWDNRYKAYEENETSLEYTTFTGSSNKFYKGMLIRQIN